MAMLSDAECDAALSAASKASPEQRLLVLGGTGNVGQHVLQRLLQARRPPLSQLCTRNFQPPWHSCALATLNDSMLCII